MHFAVGAAITLWLTPVFAAGAYRFWPSAVPAIAIGATLSLAIARAAARPMTATMAPALRHRAIAVLVALGAAAAIGQIARVSVFIANPAQVKWSYHASDPFRVRHSCMTAYVEAVRFCGQPGTNIYDMSLYDPRMIGPLKVDPFHYPPPFLLLPATVYAAAPDVYGFRRLWFVLQCVVLAGVIFGLAHWIGGDAGARAAAGGVLVLATPPAIYGLQQGNVQSTVLALATLAVVLLWRGRHAIGAPLLAYVAAAKIFPGILVVYLAAARRWKALVLTAAAGVAIVALTAALFGLRPMEDFVRYELPRISNGEAFPHTETFAYGVNFTVYGVTVRWRKLGLEWLTRQRGLAIASAYGVAVILLAALTAWRSRPDTDSPPGRLRFVQCVLALVVLAAIRSPFMPWYGFVGPIWLCTLLAAGGRTEAQVVAVWGAIAAIAAAYLWMPSGGGVPQPVHMVAADLLTVALIAVCSVTVTRAWHATAPPVRRAAATDAVA
jgi:hypothetical protein